MSAEKPMGSTDITNEDPNGSQPPTPSSPSVDTDVKHVDQPTKSPTTLSKVLDFISWMPPWCRWDAEQPPKFSTAMNLLFAFAGAFTVANLYYSHPILNILAQEFGVSDYEVSQVPTLAQSGYAIGLFFLCPLGDLLKRRPFVLTLVLFTATVWIGLCVTKSFVAFEILSFITAISTVTPQLVLPLVGDLAPPHKRASALSIVVSGNLLGILLARILSGIVTQYTSWRNIYWIAMGLNYAIFILLWLFMPDYPSTNPGGLNYFKVLWDIPMMCKRHAVLVQSSLISYCNSATFTSYWTTLTFLLSGAPYHYNSVIIGLFALIGIAAMLLGPVYARVLINKFVPIFSVIIAELVNIVGISIGTYIGTFTIAGPIIQAFVLDAGLQISQIANRSQIYAIEPNARNRVNTAFMVFTFLGQITGTAAGNKLYSLGGWIASGSLSVGLIGVALALCLIRGPYTDKWIGWQGGWSIRKKNMFSADGKTEERPNGLAADQGHKDKDGKVIAWERRRDVDVEAQGDGVMGTSKEATADAKATGDGSAKTVHGEEHEVVEKDIEKQA